MRIALFSDIHANLQALQACLAHAHAQGVERLVFLGDLVGYGADPQAVLACVARLQEEGALVLRGNHDALAADPPVSASTLGESTAAWTHDQLHAAQHQWLRTLPLTLRLEHALLVHASAYQPAQWRYVYDARAASDSLDAARANDPEVCYVFGGHVHQQTLYYRGSDAALLPFAPQPGVAVPVPRHRQWLATVGSVGQPRDGKPQAMYALFDSTRAQLTFHRVDYDHAGAAAAIRAAGLPPYFAQRLEQGR